MKIAIVEDSELDRSILLKYLTEYIDQSKFDAEIQWFQSGEEFLSAAKPDFFDLCFMDIYMNGMDGVAAAEQLRAIDPECLTIFLTSSPDHTDDAFRLRAWRYLQKPIQLEKLKEALSNCMEQLRVSKRQLTVTIDRREIAIPFSGIHYMVTANRSIEIHGKDTAVTTGKQITFDTLATQLLTDYRFFSGGKGLVINLSYVDSVEKDSVVMKNGAKLPIGRGKHTELLSALVRFRFGN